MLFIKIKCNYNLKCIVSIHSMIICPKVVYILHVYSYKIMFIQI